MKVEDLKALAVNAVEELKGSAIKVLDVAELTTITDVMIICTGRSTRHVKSIAENVLTSAKHQQVSPARMEGEKEAEWVIVDLGDVVVHVMIESARAFYHLEDLWDPIIKQREKHA